MVVVAAEHRRAEHHHPRKEDFNHFRIPAERHARAHDANDDVGQQDDKQHNHGSKAQKGEHLSDYRV